MQEEPARRSLSLLERTYVMRTVLAVLLALVMVGCQSGDKKTALTSQKDSVSYAIGMNIGGNMVRDSLDLDYSALLQGIKDAWVDSSKWLINMGGMQKCMMTFQQDLQAKKTEKQRAAGAKNREEGEKFLAENKKEAGVVTLPSGLQYKVISEGKGPKPTKDQKVVANYVGMLINGQEFDSSQKRGQPAEFPVMGVIPGWTEALQLMNVGSKWKLFIPPNLAYGDQGAGDVIAPGSTLIFEIELLSIK
jgi:FKBP-type peptidyl-prolyl cis-trans isomerase FklB